MKKKRINHEDRPLINKLGKHLQVREDGNSSSIVYLNRDGQETELEFNDSGIKIDGTTVSVGSVIGKYSTTINLVAATPNVTTTTLTTEPYSIMLPFKYEKIK